MESPGLQSEPIFEDEDIPVPCKGCGLVLEEGKAFELANNRWHIDCFRCNNCGTLLDSDANLLLLGDGSLICNSCTYSCTACGNKIEDLAILTGDQAFCAGCFRCRNCKRKIENLKYAKTSQGIFCMSCHESLMARRRKRPKAQRTPTSNSNMASPMLSLDKSLPSLPVELEKTPVESHSHSTTPTDHTARPPRIDTHRNYSSRPNPTPDQLSPAGHADAHLRTPRSHKRHSQASQVSEASADPSQSNSTQDYSFIPLALDNSPGPTPAPLTSDVYRPLEPNRQNSFDSQYHAHERRDQPAARPSYSRETSNSSYHDPRDQGARPYVGIQGRGYEQQDRGDKSIKSQDPDKIARPPANNPKASAHRPFEEHSDTQTASMGQSSVAQSGPTTVSIQSRPGEFKLGEVPKDRKKTPQVEKAATFDPSSLPPRADSFGPPPSRSESPNSRKTYESPVNSTSSSGHSQHSHATSNSSAITAAESPETSQPHKPVQLSTKTTVSNISHHESSVAAPDNQPAPRGTPPHRPSQSQSSGTQSEVSHSSSSPTILPLKSPVGGLALDEELQRVFGGESGLRRVSNSVKHGRSLSEAARQSPKWQRPGSGTQFDNVTSPASPDSREDTAVLKQELRRSTQKIAELEAKLNNSASAKVLESDIQQKRNTVALLETEREAFLRELMVIKEKLGSTKDGQPISMEELKSDLIRGLTRELESLKETLKTDIQALYAERDRLMEDVEVFGQKRDEAIREAEMLNMKNQQLADLNNELTQKNQAQFRLYHSHAKGAKNAQQGLGIFDSSSSDLLDFRDQDRRGPGSASTTGTPINEQPTDGSEVFVAQQVNPYGRSTAKKSFWGRKPAVKVFKDAGKGFNRVFTSDTARSNDVFADNASSTISLNQTQKSGAPPVFGGTQKKWGKGKNNTNGMQGSVAIFGGELEQRVDFEGQRIPSVVQKCIEEVEMRGMDMEGIYRKSGGATQMRQIQEQFERGDDVQFDPELDICSVTSVLKQYFRNLPTPLISFDLYDRFIDTSGVHDENKRVQLLKEIVNDLLPSHRHVLEFLIFHLGRVAQRNKENLMNTRNLAVVFAPTLLRHTSDEREMSDMHSKNNALQFLIDFHEAIFL